MAMMLASRVSRGSTPEGRQEVSPKYETTSDGGGSKPRARLGLSEGVEDEIARNCDCGGGGCRGHGADGSGSELWNGKDEGDAAAQAASADAGRGRLDPGEGDGAWG